MVKIDMRPAVPPRPELLLHGTLPVEAWGKAPRTQMPTERWDEIRREAYRKAQGCCMACGKISQEPLQAHETYHNGEWGEVVALCPDCHAFIHIGRTIIMAKKDREIRHIIKHGIEVLLKSNWHIRCDERMRWNMCDTLIARVHSHNRRKGVTYYESNRSN